MRGLVLASLLALAFSAQADAAPRPLAYVEGYTHFALGGPSAYAAGPGGVLAAAPTRVVFKTNDEIVGLTASPTRFAVATTTEVVTGPPARTFAAPALVQFDGERLFTITETGATAYDPDPRPIVLPARAAPELVRFAGDLMAVPTTWADRDPNFPHRRLVIQNWRTGEVLRSVDLPDEILSLDLRPDGHAIAVIAVGTLYDIAPGAEPRFLAFADPGARFAGDRVVFARATEMKVIEPGGPIRAFGVRTHRQGQFTTDDTRVLFTANDCLLLAPVTDVLATDAGAGPCPRSELEFAQSNRNARPARTLTAPMTCVAGPPRCRAQVRLTLGSTRVSTWRPVEVPSGKTRRVCIRLTADGLKRLLRATTRGRVAHLDAELRFGSQRVKLDAGPAVGAP